MINLIPKEERKNITTDFYSRLAVLFLSVVSFCILVALILMLPSFFVSSVKNSTIDARLEAQKQEPLPTLDQTILASIQNTNNELNLVEQSQKNEFPLSLKVITAIVLNKRPDIKITQILYEDDATTGKKISINGTAPSREVLLLFREALENDPNFKSVNLPISNFVKETNIQFYLSLIPS